MVCSDGTERAREALIFTTIIAVATRAEITILGITEIERDQAELSEALRAETQMFQEQGVKVDIATRFGDPVAEMTGPAAEVPMP